MGKIKIKEVSEGMRRMAAPDQTDNRTSLGNEGAVGEYYNIEIQSLKPFRNQTRKNFNQEELDHLAETIKKHGIRQPLTVIPIDKINGIYEVVSGERRLRAAIQAGLTTVPCMIIQNWDHADEIAIIENIQRQDLHPIELARSFKLLIEKGYSQAKICENLGLAKSYVSEILSLNSLDIEIQNQLIKNNLKTRDFLRKILKSPSPQKLLQSLTNKTEESSKKNQFVLRISMKDGLCTMKKSGIRKLEDIQKDLLKQELLTFIDKYLS